MATLIAERVQDGIPVQMLLTGDNTISVVSKKKNGCKRDSSHDVEDFYTMNPFMADEIRQQRSPHEVLPWLASFINQMWDEVADVDPWYIVEVEEIAEA